MKISQYNKDLKQHTKEATGYKLEGDDKQAYAYFSDRKSELENHRKTIGIEEIWRAADKAYQPNITKEKKKVF